jgi:hypothetical protein
VTVDVIVEVNESIFQRDNGGIEDQDRNRMGEVHLLGLVAVHSITNTVRVPAGVVAQNPRSQVGGFVQPDTAVAEIPPGLREEFRGRSIVHVYVVAIGKKELHQAECILWARLLPDEKLSGSELAEHLTRDRPSATTLRRLSTISNSFLAK